MSSYFYSCPYCGCFVLEGSYHCQKCNADMIPIQSQYDYDYYNRKSMEIFGDTQHWDSFILDEVKANPLFSEAKREMGRQTERAEIELHTQNYMGSLQQKNKPKCPTCGSTNIEKISVTKRAVHGAVFGLFSSTARSQMQCKNCGYKW